jgi:HTH-type transcriptional regulator / antitoxin HipB
MPSGNNQTIQRPRSPRIKSEHPVLSALAEQVRRRRKAAGLTQRALAGLSGTGVRFIVDLEQGKATLEVGKLIDVLETLGLSLTTVETRPLSFDQQGEH